jgi:hypothetical protein
MSRPKLRIVLEPAAELRELFAEEDELLKMIADCRARQRDARKRYAAANDLLMLPSVEQLRKVLGG